MYPWTDTSPSKSKQKWQRVWEDERTFHTPNPRAGRGAARTTGTSSRCCRTRPGRCTWGTSSTTRWATSSRTSAAGSGWTVLRPMGWDSFGLPAENAAIREGGHPRRSSSATSSRSATQMKRLGWVIDWDREVSRARARVLPLDAVAVPALLRARARLPQGRAGELVPERPDRGRERVRDRRALRALRHAGRGAQPRAVVLQDHRLRGRAAPLRPAAGGDWPERTKTIQRNWIGRSEGAEILFRVEELDIDIPVFTTRPDTLYGATFFVLAPEHPLVERLGNDEVHEYVAAHRRRSATRSARPRRRRPASSPATTRRTRSTASSCRSGSPTTC